MLLLGIATFLYSQDEISKITITHGPYLQNVGSNEATIVWITDKPSIGWVELASDGNGSFYAKEHPRYFDTSNGIKNTSTIHAVKVKGLTPGKQYRYRVFAQEVLKHTGYKIIYGSYASTDVYYRKPLTFHTCNPQAPATSFVMVNDIHGDNKLLEDLMSRCNLTQTDFVLFNGDMLSFINSEDQLFKGFMDTAVRLFASEIPMYYARGEYLQPKSNVIFLPVRNIFIMPFDKVLSIVLFWIREKISLILILNMPVLPNMTSTVPNSPNGWPVFWKVPNIKKRLLK